jgi:hypothetical protein
MNETERNEMEERMSAFEKQLKALTDGTTKQ